MIYGQNLIITTIVKRPKESERWWKSTMVYYIRSLLHCTALYSKICARRPPPLYAAPAAFSFNAPRLARRPFPAFKWQCRLIFESEFWKKFKVTNHRSGVTYGCTDQHLTVEKKNFQSLPSHLADTVEDVKNQPHSRWKIVFLIIQRKWPKFKKWVWPVKIP